MAAAGLAGLALWGVLAAAGDLRDRPWTYLALHLLLTALMLVTWRVLARDGSGLRLALVAALGFRLVAALGAPALSDDVHRYVWDGRVQLEGFHPYAFAPDDPALAPLRDANWERVNHREIRTIYPPLAQGLFLALTALGAGARGFCLAMGLGDFLVVLLLDHLLRRLGAPRERLVLYAWNPVAIVETAGSGHLEPVGIALVLLAVTWIIGRRIGASTAALALAVDVKLLPVTLVPAVLRRAGRRRLACAALFIACVAVPFLPYAATGPAIGGGTFAYAGSWERNAVVFPLIEAGLGAVGAGEHANGFISRAHETLGERWISPATWDFLHRHAWPPWLARAGVATLLAAWIGFVALKLRPSPPEEALLVLGGALLLSPTVHPWYALWMLPFAAARASMPWLLLAALLPASYLAGAGEVPWTLRAVEYLPPLIVAALSLRRRVAVRTGGTAAPRGERR